MQLFSRLKAIGKDSFVYGLSQVFSQLVGFLLLPVYTAYLTPSDYGVLAMLSLIPILLPALVNLGLNNAVFRFYSQCNTELERAQLIGTSHLLVLVFSLVVVINLLFFSTSLCTWLTDSTDHLAPFNLMVLSAWLTSISTIPLVVLKQQRKVTQIAIRSLIGLVVNASTTVFFVVHLEWGVLGCVIGNAVGSATGALLLIIAVSHRTWAFFDRGRVRALLRYSVPFVPYFVQAVMMGIVGQYVVKEQIGLEEAGYYSIALRFTLPLVLILGAFNNSWAAFKFDIRYNDENPRKSYREIFSFYIIMVAGCWLVISLWMPHVLQWVVAPEYYRAAGLIPLVAMIPVVQNVRGMLTTGLEMSNSPKFMPFLTLIGLVSLVLFSYVLVPDFNTVGAAISVILGWAVTAVLTYFYSQRIFRIEYDLRLVFWVVVVVLAIYLFPFGYYLNSFVSAGVKTAFVLTGVFFFLANKKSFAGMISKIAKI